MITTYFVIGGTGLMVIGSVIAENVAAKRDALEVARVLHVLTSKVLPAGAIGLSVWVLVKATQLFL